MTDAITIDERLHEDVHKALHNVRWLTPREVHAKAAQWTLIKVRHALRDMAERGEVRTQIVGPDERPVREYRRK